MKGLLCLVFLNVMAVCWAGAPFELCKGQPTDVKVTGITVPDCTGPPCEIKKGTNVSITITFTTSKIFPSLKNKVYGEIGGIDVIFPGYPDSMTDICKLGVTCPTKAGGSYTEKVQLPVSNSDPAISVTAKWEFQSGGTTVGCMEVPLKIVS